MGNVLGKAAAVDFAIQWGMFLLAAYFKTEKFFDATGSATFLVLMVQSLLHARRFFPRQVVQSGLVATWATRLGLFLATRVLRDGRDSRFNRVRDNPRRFFIYWTVQGVQHALVVSKLFSFVHVRTHEDSIYYSVSSTLAISIMSFCRSVLAKIKHTTLYLE